MLSCTELWEGPSQPESKSTNALKRSYGLWRCLAFLMSCDVMCVDSREGRGTVLSCEAEAFASFKQKWTLKLAKTVSSIFADKTASYRRRSNFEAFASYGMDSRLSPVPNVPFPHHIHDMQHYEDHSLRNAVSLLFSAVLLVHRPAEGSAERGYGFLAAMVRPL